VSWCLPVVSGRNGRKLLSATRFDCYERQCSVATSTTSPAHPSDLLFTALVSNVKWGNAAESLITFRAIKADKSSRCPASWPDSPGDCSMRIQKFNGFLVHAKSKVQWKPLGLRSCSAADVREYLDGNAFQKLWWTIQSWF
jgi:hypothetical protein